MNNAELIVRTLRDAGVTHGFGVPSGNVLPMIEAMRTGGIEFVLTAHEGSAAFAADVFGRLTGRPGFCLATLGPGATNLTTGVGDAYLDRSPMIALTCNLDTDQLGRRRQMYIDHHALFGPLTKATRALRKGRIAATLGDALELALSEPVGPVHLDLPEDVSLAQSVEETPESIQARPLRAAPQAQLDRFDTILREANRPMVVVGASAMRMAEPDLLRRFVEHHELPFASTTMAKGMIDERHELSVGCIERGCRQLQRKFLRSCDLIVGIGYDVVEVELEQWIDDVPFLGIDIEPVDAGPSVQVRHEVVGDLDNALARLCDNTPVGARNWQRSEVGTHRGQFQRALRPAVERFAVHEAIDAVRDVLPEEGILAFDVGAHTHQIASQWPVYRPRQFLITNGWSSMGFGLPAAIAARLACPSLPTVALIGDGCFQMTCGEVATARRMGLCLPIVVLVDDWLSLIQVKQHRRQMGIYGTSLLPEGYAEPPVHYFGAPAVGARSSEELRSALLDALQRPGPTIIEAFVDSTHYMQTVFD